MNNPRLRFLTCLASLTVLTFTQALAVSSGGGTPVETISTQEPVVALAGATLIDGTGALCPGTRLRRSL
jgi:hypothetical protein